VNQHYRRPLPHLVPLRYECWPVEVGQEGPLIEQERLVLAVFAADQQAVRSGRDVCLLPGRSGNVVAIDVTCTAFGVRPAMMTSESGDGTAASPITPARRPG